MTALHLMPLDGACQALSATTVIKRGLFMPDGSGAFGFLSKAWGCIGCITMRLGVRYCS